MSMFGEVRVGEADAQRRTALRTVAHLAERYRAVIWTAVEAGAGLDEAHAQADDIAREAYRVLAGVGILGGQAVAEWCRATARAQG